jgi:predicted small metal-binding protein
MVDFHCGDAVTGCEFVARGERIPEVLLEALRHLRDQHRETLTLARIREVQRHLHDDGSEEHLRSLARARGDRAARGGAGGDPRGTPGEGPGIAVA